MPHDLAKMPYGLRTRFRAAALDLIERARAGRLDEAGLRAGLHRLALRCRRPAGDLWEHYSGGRRDGSGRPVSKS